MFKKLLQKLDKQINEDWDFCDGYGTCVRWPVSGGQAVKSYKLKNHIIDKWPQKEKDEKDLF